MERHLQRGLTAASACAWGGLSVDLLIVEILHEKGFNVLLAVAVVATVCAVILHAVTRVVAATTDQSTRIDAAIGDHSARVEAAIRSTSADKWLESMVRGIQRAQIDAADARSNTGPFRAFDNFRV